MGLVNATTGTLSNQVLANSATLHVERVRELPVQTALIVGRIRWKISEEFVNAKVTIMEMRLRQQVVKNVMRLVKNVLQLEHLAV